MLTGDTPITFGDAFINTFSVKANSRVALKSIGYCPQVDALLDELTAREHLQLYARYLLNITSDFLLNSARLSGSILLFPSKIIFID